MGILGLGICRGMGGCLRARVSEDGMVLGFDDVNDVGFWGYGVFCFMVVVIDEGYCL